MRKTASLPQTPNKNGCQKTKNQKKEKRKRKWKKQTNTKLFYEFKLILISYVKYVIPLIVIAAFTETYVADWISHILS